MSELSKKADRIFRRIGDRGVLLLMFLAGVIAHTALALHMEAFSIIPDEFVSAAWASLFAGNGFGGIISRTDGYYGWLGALFYSPVMLVVRNPFVRYKAMLVINGIIASFIPLIAYKIAGGLGVKKAWMRVLTAAVCGMYPAVFAHTKFIWNETFCLVFPWVAALIITAACNAKNRVYKHFLSALLALTLTASVCAHPRLASVAAAAVAAALFARFYLKKKVIFLSSFIPALAVFSAGFFVLTGELVSLMWGSGGVILRNTLSDFFPVLERLFMGDADTWARLLKAAAGHLYYFTSSTWGLGVLGVCLFIGALAGRRRVFGKEKQPVKSAAVLSVNERFLVFSAFALLSALFSGAVSVLFKSGADGFTEYQDAVIFGRYMDGVIPLTPAFVICYVFLYGLDLRKLLPAIVALGGIYTAFFLLCARTLVNAPNVSVYHVLGLYPLRIGEKVDALITMDGLFLTVSAVFSLMALFIVFVCCAKRYRVRIISATVALIAFYSCAYTVAAYLPFVARTAREVNAPIHEASEYVYDSDDAPPLIALDVPERTAALLQFLNRGANVITKTDGDKIPENCFVVVESGYEFAPPPEVETAELGGAGGYVFYACGEKAIMYANSQSE
ncbi:MAG: hypothetical protein LBI38_00820 [Oscillospiraceae bacterium]|nr:hypothetical protein [Oscillospiraceae bacterium]